MAPSACGAEYGWNLLNVLAILWRGGGGVWVWVWVRMGVLVPGTRRAPPRVSLYCICLFGLLRPNGTATAQEVKPRGIYIHCVSARRLLGTTGHRRGGCLPRRAVRASDWSPCRSCRGEAWALPGPCSPQGAAESHKRPLERVLCRPLWRTGLSGRATGHMLLVSIHGLRHRAPGHSCPRDTKLSTHATPIPPCVSQALRETVTGYPYFFHLVWKWRGCPIQIAPAPGDGGPWWRGSPVQAHLTQLGGRGGGGGAAGKDHS